MQNTAYLFQNGQTFRSQKLKLFSSLHFNDKPLWCSANASRPVEQGRELDSGKFFSIYFKL